MTSDALYLRADEHWGEDTIVDDRAVGALGNARRNAAPPIVGSVARSTDPAGEALLLQAYRDAVQASNLARPLPDARPAAAPPSPFANAMADLPLRGKRVLVVVENLPVPFDRRVWLEARTIAAAGAKVSVICPRGRGHDRRYECIDGIHIYRHPLPVEASGAGGFLLEYAAALFWQLVLTSWILVRRGIDVIHGCNPPDLVFLIAWPLKLLGVRFIFDHHDLSPELFEAKFARRGVWWKLLLVLERLTFRAADVTIATNESYRRVAIDRGNMASADVFVVRSGPDLDLLRRVDPVEEWKNGRQHLVGYVGVMGAQEGIDLLIEAVDHIVRRRGRKDVQFCLVGSGPNLNELQALVHSKRLEPYVRFTGRASDQHLIEVLSTMDVGVNPDRVNAMNDKSTMNKIMEYMSVGKPIVQFDVTEGRESARESSLYAKPNDPIDLAEKLLSLIDDPVRSRRMGELGRERVEQSLGWAHQVEPLINAYRAALTRRAPLARRGRKPQQSQPPAAQAHHRPAS